MIRCNAGHVGKRACKAIESTAIIIQITVGIGSVRCRVRWNSGRGRNSDRPFIDFLNMVAEQRDDANYLRRNEQRR
jgi:hypothetical protein